MLKRLLVLVMVVGVAIWATVPVQAFGHRRARCCSNCCGSSNCGYASCGCGYSVNNCGCNNCGYAANNCNNCAPCQQMTYVDQQVTCMEQRWVERQVPVQVQRPVMRTINEACSYQVQVP